MIAELNEHFIPVELNLTLQPFPNDVPGLKNWRWVFAALPNLKNGFVATVVLDSTGKKAISDAGTSNINEIATAINYNPAKYLAFLQDALQRFEDWNY